MQKFNQKVEVLLNGFLGSLASGVGSLASGAGSFLKAAEDPKAGIDIIRKSLDKKDKEKIAPIGSNSKNKPKVGKMVVYADNNEITGRIRTKLDKNKKFGVELLKIEPNGKLVPSEFVFAKTKSKPYWRIEYSDVIFDKHNNGSDPIISAPNQAGKMVQQVSPSKSYPYVLVGKGSRYQKWLDWETFQKSQKFDN